MRTWFAQLVYEHTFPKHVLARRADDFDLMERWLELNGYEPALTVLDTTIAVELNERVTGDTAMDAARTAVDVVRAAAQNSEFWECFGRLIALFVEVREDED